VGQQPGRPAHDPRAFAGELAQGNVVLSVADRRALTAAKRLAREVSGGDDEAALRAAGQAIRVVAPECAGARCPSPATVLAQAHGRAITARSLDDPELRAFLEYWLGRAAG
jgi:hypothetical protein